MKSKTPKQYVLKVVTKDYTSLYLPEHLKFNYEFGVWQKAPNKDFPFHVYKVDSGCYPEYSPYEGRRLLICEAKEFSTITRVLNINYLRYYKLKSFRDFLLPQEYYKRFLECRSPITGARYVKPVLELRQAFKYYSDIRASAEAEINKLQNL